MYEEDYDVEMQKMRHGETANLRYEGKCSHGTQLGAESAGKRGEFPGDEHIIANYIGCMVVGNNADKGNARALTL